MDPESLRNKAAEAFRQHDWQTLLQLAPRLADQFADDAPIRFMAGTACLKLKDLPGALRYLSQAHAIDDSNVRYATEYAMALSMAQQPNKALEVAAHAQALAPDDAGDWDRLGVVFTQNLAYDKASKSFEEAIKRDPGCAGLYYNLATTLKALGRTDEAERALKKCLSLDECHWPAHYSLAHLGHSGQAREHIAQIEAVLPRAEGNLGAEMPLRVAWSREHENLGEYAQAFEQLAKGKQLGKQAVQYDFSRDENLFSAITQAFHKPLARVNGFDSSEPIFIVGMPRSGTTLVERIISSHSGVCQIGEPINFGLAMKRLSGSRTRSLLDPETVAGLKQVDWHALGKLYVDSTRPTTGHTPHFIDKLPHNFLNLGHIARALPNAAIICLHRHPMDTCLGNFRELFTLGSPYWDYSFDILDIGRYYLQFRKLMAHWTALFPGRILEVQYEDLVRNQEPLTRELLAHCKLEWEDSCLHFENNPLPVASASSTQVRSGMHQRNMGRWKKYRSQLAELEALLASEGVSFELRDPEPDRDLRPQG